MRQLLVVDDEPVMARVFAVALEREGWSVHSACTGEEALEMISRGAPDAMITDIRMPGIGGRGLCEAIRSNWPEREFPIFVMTSLTGQGEREWVEQLGGIEFVEKPVSPRYFATRLAARFAEKTP